MNAPIYLFDGDCLLCSRAVQYMLAHEREPVTRFVAIQSGEGRALALTHEIDPDDPDSFLYIVGDVPYQKWDAVLQIVRRMRGPARLLVISQVLLRPLRDWIYDMIAKNRYRIIGRVDHCYVPSPETRHRFVLPLG